MVLAGICGVHESASAGFYQWIDKGDRKHVSNIPRRGVMAPWCSAHSEGTGTNRDIELPASAFPGRCRAGQTRR